MPTRVFSAVIEVDTRYNAPAVLQTGSVQQKGRFLESCVRDAVAGFAKLGDAAGGPMAGELQIIAAPEYFFGLPQNDTDGSVFAYNHLSAAALDGQCRRVSGMFPNILIIPGTTLFKKFVGRRERAQLAADLLQARGTETQSLTAPDGSIKTDLPEANYGETSSAICVNS